MHLSQTLLSLPASLVMLVATQLQAQQILLPTAIKKMSLDEGEKIMPEHLGFAPEYAPLQSRQQVRALLTPEEELLLAVNSSAIIGYRPPFGVHAVGVDALELRNNGPSWRRAKEALHRLQGRDYSCPTNTESCESIGQPNYCCATGETCVEVEDQPDAGNVGCCPDGQTCGGTVGPCGSDSTACAAEVGGGCCISGFVCAQIGCIASTVTVITMTTTSSTVLSDSTAVTTVVVTTSPSIITTESTSTSSTSTSSTIVSTSTASATDTDTTSTTTGTALPPWRPTSGSESNTITTTSADYCPTGFYACLATYGSGCCRTGRDCVTTSCPPISSTTITSNGATIVVPASDVPTTTATSTCASGWYLCGTAAGPVAGCCPSGYACGTASCTLSATTATATVQKELPSNASRTTGILSLAMGVAGLLVVLMT
ncbi:hypothetical protein PFICI_13358 [Pestalotiopsis fici W106-1]|uniref:GPI anchored protein n=1 Tax=Pestalotiopsis fici (strain W106-1 / CGMCC3.15140) TaxID=1229662 RepID=W3WM85_PESFW|nr:uncharacterized protein PFICI_13358 [Pestalotiopsis fici W106-1]ETS74874.1 hypothetical protein PFICI_13358 [Pestalotiopsis fici W106-1]